MMQVFSTSRVLHRGVALLHKTHTPAVSLLKKFHVSATEPETLFHEIKDTKSGKVRRIAYHKTSGPRSVGVIYVPGFMSDKSAIKAQELHPFCQKYGFPYVRYDPSGLGDSEGVELTEARMSSWVEDAREIIIKVSDGPQIIVASSMGCWISSIIAKEHPEKFAGLLMLAPAFNFGEKYEKVLLSQLTPKLLKKYEDGGVVNLYAPDYGEFPLSLAQFEDMKQLNITKATDSMPVTCPVRIIHGIKDKDVPYMESLQLLPALQTPNVTLTYLKHAGHRLSDVTSLDVILDTVLKLASTLHPRENNS